MPIIIDIPDSIEQRLRNQHPDLEKEFLTIIVLHFYRTKFLSKCDFGVLLGISDQEVSVLFLQRDIDTTLIDTEYPSEEDVTLAKTASEMLKKTDRSGELEIWLEQENNLKRSCCRITSRKYWCIRSIKWPKATESQSRFIDHDRYTTMLRHTDIIASSVFAERNSRYGWPGSSAKS